MLDFSTLGNANGTVKSLGNGATTAGSLTAQAYQKSNVTGNWSASTLVAQNLVNDRGLGVCSSNETTCNVGGAGTDYSELSQRENTEAILLSLAPDWKWSELWVSSLNSGANPDKGRIYWGNSSDVSTLISSGNTFAFQAGDFGSGVVEGNILSLTQASIFDQNARYVLFMPNGNKGDKNDFLVYGAGLRAPLVSEPASALLLLSALGAGAARLRRRNRQ